MAAGGLNLNPPIFGIDHYYYTEQNNYMEKRQVFLRSYQFCRKRSVPERMRTSFIRVKRVICLRLRTLVRKFRKLLWSRLRYGFYNKKTRLFRLIGVRPNLHRHQHGHWHQVHDCLLSRSASDCPPFFC